MKRVYNQAVATIRTVSSRLKIIPRSVFGRATVSQVRIAVFAVYLLSISATYPVVAQFDEVGEALCDSGFGELILYGIALFSVVLLFKVIFQVMSALDKYKSTRPGEHEEGVQKMESAVWTLVAAIAPVMLAAVFDLVGIYTFSCLELDIGIID